VGIFLHRGLFALSAILSLLRRSSFCGRASALLVEAASGLDELLDDASVPRAQTPLFRGREVWGNGERRQVFQRAAHALELGLEVGDPRRQGRRRWSPHDAERLAQ
jgi:hypothetical protein